jgi:HPt (histidine-containing phosphotransfer) domain-containing protein
MAAMALNKTDWKPGSLVLERSALERLEKVGGADLLVRLIDRFIETTPTVFENACDQGKAGDMLSLRTSARRMADAASNLGAVALREGAAKLEKLCSIGARDLVLPLLVQVNGLLEEAKDRLLSEKQGILSRSRLNAWR